MIPIATSNPAAFLSSPFHLSLHSALASKLSNKRARGKEEEHHNNDNNNTSDKSSQMNQDLGEMKCKVRSGLLLAIDQDTEIISDSESHHDNKLTANRCQKRPRVPKTNLPSTPTLLPPLQHATPTPISAREELKEREVLCRWYVASEMSSDNTVPLAVHFLERLGRPWLLLAPSLVAHTQLMCFASCLWVAACLTETPTTLDRACVLLPKCTGIPHRFLMVAEARLRKLFRWQIGGEGHATSP